MDGVRVDEKTTEAIETDKATIKQLRAKLQAQNAVPKDKQLHPQPEPVAQKYQTYKVHVGMGNNSTLIRSVFKQRYWWLLHDKEEMDRVNFMWTQVKKDEIFE